IAIDGREQITELVKYVRHHYPDVHIVARAIDRDHVYDLWHAGCRDIVRETYDSSLRMARSSIEALGYNRDQASRMTDAFTELDRGSMVMAAEHYDPDVPMHENDAYMGRVRELRGDWEAEMTVRVQKIMDEKTT
ncbi:MAG TPA: potassium transporter, partial [Sulfitobacter sp.]|nr:potassium transporter [Sulfitobacter sp.]